MSTERVHVTRSRAKPGGAAQSDPDVIPFRSRKPPWLKVKAPGGPSYRRIERLMRSKSLHTVCEEANCPNIGECWERGTATFMILGDVCTRRCGFCNVKSGVPDLVDRAEPLRVAHAVQQMGLRHCVVTSVDRDDLPDGGAGAFADTIRAIRKRAPDCAVEVLTPDFRGQEMPLARVIDARPDVFNHNVETVPRLYPKARRGSDFLRSCRVLRNAKHMDPDVVTKSGLMVGLGETMDEMLAAFALLREHEVQVLTVGQYLRPPRITCRWCATGSRTSSRRWSARRTRWASSPLHRARSCAARTTRTSRCPSAARTRPLSSRPSRGNLRP